MEKQDTDCAFEVGQWVIFKPDVRLSGHQVMYENLTPGEHYKIGEIRDAAYVVVEGHPSAGGGLHWSAFKAV